MHDRLSLFCPASGAKEGEASEIKERSSGKIGRAWCAVLLVNAIRG